MGKSSLEIRVLLDEEQTKIFNEVKKALGLKTNAETCRAVIKRVYDEVKKQE